MTACCSATSPAGSGPRRPCCWRSPPFCTCGTWKPPATPTRSTRRPSRPAPRTGPPCSSAPSMPATRSPWTSHRRRCGFRPWPGGSSASRPLSMLVPQALMGVAAVGLLYLTVKRVSGPAAGLLAGGALALTPVAALMFRFNNPDALLTLCLVLAAYLTTRAIEKAGWKWLAAAGAVIGLAFLTKMLQGFLIVPGLALAYLWAAPDHARPAAAAPAGRGRRDRPRRRQLRRAVPADPGLSPPLHGRLREQQLPGTHLRLQRPGPDHRFRRRHARRRHRRTRRRRAAAATSASAERPASPGCSAPASAARCPGCCRLP